MAKFVQRDNKGTESLNVFSDAAGTRNRPKRGTSAKAPAANAIMTHIEESDLKNQAAKFLQKLYTYTVST